MGVLELLPEFLGAVTLVLPCSLLKNKGILTVSTRSFWHFCIEIPGSLGNMVAAKPPFRCDYLRLPVIAGVRGPTLF